MTKRADKMEALREKLLKKPMESRWRIRRKEKAAFNRYKMVELLLKADKPLKETQICFEMQRSLESTKNDLRVLFDNNIVCNRLDANDGAIYYAVCPNCPLRENCENKLDFWVQSGLLNAEPLPSEQFAEEASG